MSQSLIFHGLSKYSIGLNPWNKQYEKIMRTSTNNSSYLCDGTTVNLISHNDSVYFMHCLSTDAQIDIFLDCLLPASSPSHCHMRKSSITSFGHHVFEACPSKCQLMCGVHQQSAGETVLSSSETEVVNKRL